MDCYLIHFFISLRQTQHARIPCELEKSWLNKEEEGLSTQPLPAPTKATN